MKLNLIRKLLPALKEAFKAAKSVFLEHLIDSGAEKLKEKIKGKEND